MSWKKMQISMDTHRWGSETTTKKSKKKERKEKRKKKTKTKD
jgi:hypothetical protein